MIALERVLKMPSYRFGEASDHDANHTNAKCNPAKYLSRLDGRFPLAGGTRVRRRFAPSCKKLEKCDLPSLVLQGMSCDPPALFQVKELRADKIGIERADFNHTEVVVWLPSSIAISVGSPLIRTVYQSSVSKL